MPRQRAWLTTFRSWALRVRPMFSLTTPTGSEFGGRRAKHRERNWFAYDVGGRTFVPRTAPASGFAGAGGEFNLKLGSRTLTSLDAKTVFPAVDVTRGRGDSKISVGGAGATMKLSLLIIIPGPSTLRSRRTKRGGIILYNVQTECAISAKLGRTIMRITHGTRPGTDALDNSFVLTVLRRAPPSRRDNVAAK